MHVASRESLAAARERLDEFIDRARATDLGTVSDELFAVVGLLDREPLLRRALSDPSTDPDSRAGLLDGVLGDRLDPRTLDLLRDMVRAHWSEPGDLTDSVEAIARQAAFGVAERGGTLDEVEDELFRFGRIVEAEPRLRSLLSDIRAPADRRIGLLDQIVEDRVNPTTRRLLEQTVRAPRGRTLERVIDELVQLAADRRQRYVAYVRAAVPLTPEEESRLAAVLSRIYGRAVGVQVDVDPSVIGGLMIQIKDEVIDGTIASRLAAVRHRLGGGRTG
jgi:F-type H+-transporting ATPase subunit delta